MLIQTTKKLGASERGIRIPTPFSQVFLSLSTKTAFKVPHPLDNGQNVQFSISNPPKQQLIILRPSHVM
jgi:hypothetical protein